MRDLERRPLRAPVVDRARALLHVKNESCTNPNFCIVGETQVLLDISGCKTLAQKFFFAVDFCHGRQRTANIIIDAFGSPFSYLAWSSQIPANNGSRTYMLDALWEFIKHPANRDVLGWIGGGILWWLVGCGPSLNFFQKKSQGQAPKRPMEALRLAAT
jgi:hypothetical protein